MDKNFDMQKSKLDLKHIEDKHKLSCKRREILKCELNKLSEEIILLKNKLERRKQSLNYYEITNKKLYLQSQHLLLQQDKAKMTYFLNKNIIEKYEQTEKLNNGTRDYQELKIDQSKSTLIAKKERLLQERNRLKLTVREHFIIIKTNIKRKRI